MVVHPLKSARSKIYGAEGDYFLTGFERCVQPNAIDIPVKSIFAISYADVRLTPNDKEIVSSKVKLDSPWRLTPGMYEYYSLFEVEIADDECAWVLPRSTLIRNGIHVLSGLYDSGYKGTIGGGIYVGPTSVLELKPGACIGQLFIMKAESTHLYNGTYQGMKAP